MLLDTYALVEFFKGTGKGKQVEKIIKTETAYASIVSVAEIAEWCFKNDLEPEKYLDAINSSIIVLNFNETVMLLAGQINFENKKKIKNWGMIDSLIYSTGIFYKLKIVTGDNHFKNLPNTLII